MVRLNILVTLLIVMTYCGSVICWLDLIRIFPIENKSNNKTRPLFKQMSGCRKDRQCQPQQFCHRYDKTCMKCRNEGETCRRNKMCCRGMECAGGKCRIKVRLGTKGALCAKDRDCNYGFCCAREKGQYVCKPMLLEGNRCGIPKGGRMYLWSHQCPCTYGLKCKRAKRKPEKIIELIQDWNDDKYRRCVRSPYINT